jgi:hypothetical protein
MLACPILRQYKIVHFVKLDMKQFPVHSDSESSPMTEDKKMDLDLGEKASNLAKNSKAK